MNTEGVQSVIGTLQSHLSEKDWYIPDRDRCTNPYAVVDEIFTMNKPEETLPPGYTAVSHITEMNIVD